MKTISAFCWERYICDLAEEFGTSVRIYNTRLGGESIELGVNWSSVGTVSAEEAQRFADQLTKAAAIAASSPVNGARIVYAN